MANDTLGKIGKGVGTGAAITTAGIATVGAEEFTRAAIEQGIKNAPYDDAMKTVVADKAAADAAATQFNTDYLNNASDNTKNNDWNNLITKDQQYLDAKQHADALRHTYKNPFAAGWDRIVDIWHAVTHAIGGFFSNVGHVASQTVTGIEHSGGAAPAGIAATAAIAAAGIGTAVLLNKKDHHDKDVMQAPQVSGMSNSRMAQDVQANRASAVQAEKAATPEGQAKS